ncbi:alpha-N-arabinofuranosidase II precursor [Neurospora tetraspora]|uniref:non-reducing end alpha-L-arabinofuranosidase n=1 Tax=Neurospora tetraspora TaxID=94610 RepID=A0AAE0IZY1_9PEZI|nr:alpha-N-arabinofuranosidase II precursor [Neurospora tetraspora]
MLWSPTPKLWPLLVFLSLLLLLSPSTLALTPSPLVTYTNTLIPQRADPHISKHTDGYYYFTATVPAYDSIIVRRAPTIQGLASAPETTIWRRKSSGIGSNQVWAPELHYIDGKWYIYVALGVANEWRIRAFVLEGVGSNPQTATWSEKGLVNTDWDTFSLDAHQFQVNGTRYLVWAQQEPSRTDENSSLLLAKLVNPWTIQRPATVISRPLLSWERIGYKVNEGPATLQKNGKIFLTYSASATDSNYCMGLLTASVGADLLNAASWSKSQTPVFQSNSLTKQYGPGHNSFTVSEDNLSDILVFHDRGYPNITGDPLNDPNRRTRVQKIYWRADGTPDLGIPVPDGATPVRLRSFSSPGSYIRYYTGTSPSGSATLADQLFRIITPGLAGGNTVSLESASRPGLYLRRSGTQVRFDAGSSGSSASFKSEASWNRREGLTDAAKGVSFEAAGVSGQYLRLTGVDGGLVLAAVGGDQGQRGQATFYLE